MAHIITFANHKGGVGKTTTTANVGSALALQGEVVLLVDLDAQQNLTGTFLQEDADSGVYDALSGKTDILPVVKVRENLYLAPAGIELAEADINLRGQDILKNVLEPLRDSYDYILIDCPPSLGILTLNALVACDDLYIPMTAEYYPLKGLSMLEKVTERIRRSGANPNLEISGVIITRYNRRTLNNAVINQIVSRYGDRVFKTRVRECIAVAEAPLEYKDIFSYAEGSNGATDYRELAEEIAERHRKRR